MTDEKDDLEKLRGILGESMVTSVFDGTFDGKTPVSGLFPKVLPSLEEPEIIEHELMGWKEESNTGGILFKYAQQLKRVQGSEFTQPWPKPFLSLAQFCNVKSRQYRYLKEALDAADDEVKKVATKFVRLAEMIKEDEKKTVVMCHRNNGFAPLVMYLQQMFPGAVGSYPTIDKGGKLPPAGLPDCRAQCSCQKCTL